MIRYEHPLNERIRTLMRLEDLFTRVRHFAAHEAPADHHAALVALFEITDVAARAGVTKPTNSFPTWFWDVDNDGALDLFVANYDTGVAHLASWLVGGALRFEDKASGLTWITITGKSMLLDTRQGRQLANDCRV